jgi:integrase
MATIESITQAKKIRLGVHPVKDAKGVTLRKTSTAIGSGALNLRFWFGEDRLTMSLGLLSDFDSIDGIREAAAAKRLLIRKGVNPIVERDRELAGKPVEDVVTFERATMDHLETFGAEWKHPYARAVWLNPLKEYAFPVVGHLSVNEIRVRHVVKILKAAAKGRPTPDGEFLRPAPETGRRIRARIEAIINGAIALDESDSVLRNPAEAGRVGKVFPLKRKKGSAKHFRRIKDIADAPTLFRALSEAGKAASGIRATELDAWGLTISCALRPSEAVTARWGEVDFNKKVLVKPAAAMKGAVEHIVPLSALAVGILERRDKARVRSRTGDRDKDAAADAAAFIFTGPSGNRPINYTGFALAPARLGLDLASPHSWRSVFRDWAATIAHVDGDIAELALAHSLGPVKGAYFQDTAVERRRGVMADYASWLTGLAGENVVAFPFASKRA